MTKQLNIQKDLKQQYFWDVDINKLDAGRSRRLIIERVFNLGTFNEIKMVVSYYGTNEVINVLKKLNYIDPKTLNFVSKFFKISFQSFKCYRRRQLHQLHWNS